MPSLWHNAGLCAVGLFALFSGNAFCGGARMCGLWVPPDFPGGVSGITRAGEDAYYAVSDRGGKVYSVTLRIDRVSGGIITNFWSDVCVCGSKDSEGIAFSHGVLWVCDEADDSVSGWKIPSCGGEPVRTERLSFLDFAGMHKHNMGLESLTISPDGTNMWTAFEGPFSNGGESGKETERIVRLMHCVRESPEAPWKPAEQYAYPLDPSKCTSFRGVAVNGVSEMCVMSDGQLLVMERDAGKRSRIPSVRIRIYAAEPGPESEIKDDTPPVPMRKRLVYEQVGLQNFEGMCEGPVLDDGRLTVILAADGDYPLPGGIAVLGFSPLDK